MDSIVSPAFNSLKERGSTELYALPSRHTSHVTFFVTDIQSRWMLAWGKSTVRAFAGATVPPDPARLHDKRRFSLPNLASKRLCDMGNGDPDFADGRVIDQAASVRLKIHRLCHSNVRQRISRRQRQSEAPVKGVSG
jgi:hypothetical protein